MNWDGNGGAFNPIISINGAGARGLPVKALGYADVIQALIDGGNGNVASLVAEYRNADTPYARKRQIKGDRARVKDGVEYAAEDGLLPSYMCSGLFPQGNRGQTACEAHAGVMAFDLDKFERAADIDSQMSRLYADPHIYYALRSASGNGIHFGVRIAAPDGVDLTDKDIHKRGWGWVNEWAVKNLGVNPNVDDPTSKNINRIHFATHDAGGFINRSVTALAIPASAFDGRKRAQSKRASGVDINLALIDVSYLTPHINANDAAMYEGVVACLLALDPAQAEAYRRICEAANPESTRTAQDRLARLDIERDSAAAFAKVLAWQKANGWQHPNKGGRPSQASQERQARERMDEAGVPADAVWLSPVRSEAAEVARFYQYAVKRILYIYGEPAAICDTDGYWIGIYTDEGAMALTTLLDACRDKAVAELRGYEGLDDEADRLARTRLGQQAFKLVRQTIDREKSQHGVESVTPDKMNQRAYHGIFPLDGGVYEVRTGNVITDANQIRKMYLRRPSTPTPPPNFAVLDNPASELTGDELSGAIAMRTAIETHFGQPVLNRLALPILGVWEGVTLIQNNQSNSGKGTLRRALQGAFPETQTLINRLDLTRTPRFDAAMAALATDTWVHAEEVGKVVEDKPGSQINRIFDLTLDILRYERKSENEVSRQRVGMLVMWTAEIPPIKFHQQGMERRLTEITLFAGDGLKIDAEIARTINRNGAAGAAIYLRAHMLRTATALARHGDVDAVEYATRTPAGIARLETAKLESMSEAALRISEAYEYTADYIASSAELAQCAGVGKTDPGLRGYIREAIQMPGGGVIQSKRARRDGRRDTYWQCKPIDDAPADTPSVDAGALNGGASGNAHTDAETLLSNARRLSDAGDWIADGAYTPNAKALMARAAAAGYEWTTQADGSGLFIERTM